MAKTNAEYQRDSKQSKKDQGLVRREHWILDNPEAIDSLKQHADKLRRKMDDKNNTK